MVLKKIPIDDNPSLVNMIENSYLGAPIHGVTVHKITIDHNDVNIELDLDIGDNLGIHGTLQIGLDDYNTLSEKLREIISLEDGND